MVELATENTVAYFELLSCCGVFRSADIEGRNDGEDLELVEGDLRRTKEELRSVQAEREQAQREYKDVKQQLDELTAQANTKLSDQRSKMKVSKRRSMLRYGPGMCYCLCSGYSWRLYCESSTI